MPTPLKTREELEAIWRTQWSPIRSALHEGDPDALIAAVRDRATTESTGCWLWPNLKDGYPTINIGGRTHSVHRLVLEAKHRAPLGTQHAHHICANSGCVNPDHLQPVTHRENVAEMLARQSYLARIAELESVVKALDPHHPTLQLVAVA